MAAYNDKLDPEQQIDAEEAIAAAIFDHPDVECSEQAAADLGRAILKKVLARFRRDLFDRRPRAGKGG